MSETNTNQQPGQTQPDIAAELNRLGENLGKLLRATWETDELKSVEREIQKGFDEFNRHINNAIEQARNDQNVKKATDTIKDAWVTAHGPQLVDEMRMGLADSLKRLNDELAKRAEMKPAQEVKSAAATAKESMDAATGSATDNPVTDAIQDISPE
jgi:predicted transcriptional regulator